ncbi:adenylosuccinate lyase family protein [Rhodophyticola sp. CCM32]|uniref:lyase family protein n=1 Tax=Rhodophyticola sp. CCM32 TaxID=2916397 RepID=UPI00107F02E2|nr:lyase family protein [Rhodophyticola sp. CCM32]QBX99861.1 adenylosuccinate lyase family protein [Rhodophyticola sp. CCM32]
MSVSAFDSPLYRDLFTDRETARLFTDSAEIRAMLLVEGALARAQGALGLIPAEAGAAIHRASLEVQIDPAALAGATGENGVPIPGLLTAFRAEIGDPQTARYLHWGATSQDIIDTALALRLRQALSRINGEASRLARALADLAETHAETPMAGRTYGQHATPTSFGAVAASWGRPILSHQTRLEALRPGLLSVSLSGAAGTGAAFGPDLPALRQALADALDLTCPPGSWHSQRDNIAALAGWLTGLTGSCGKIGEDLILLTQTDIAEVTLGRTGTSSTMPQKQNPVGASVLVALARHNIALNGAMQSALLHRQDRDGAAWFTEWLSLPPMIMGAAKAVALAADLAETLQPNLARMAANMAGNLDLIHAEMLSQALSTVMTIPESKNKIKVLCEEAKVTQTALTTLVARDFPGLDLAETLNPGTLLGHAPAEARAFADTVRKRQG